uniref:Uncharacterized protein n=1 Tax=Phytophthora fragariae TaxID=53985 RepID=A0A6A3DKX8_9STRA|nr:hypothetical protein PF009_g29326 [Phytophthora fragariae]
MSTLPTSTDARTPRRERPAAGGRGAGFSTEEVQSFLETLEQHLPLGRDEWELVLSIHHQHFRAYNRTVDSLRLRLAKRVRYLMTQRADIGEGDDVNKADLGIAVEEGQQQAAEDVLLQSQADERARRVEQQSRRDEESRRWDEERRQQEQVHQEERARREEADRCHEQLMQMMMTIVSAAFKPRE